MAINKSDLEIEHVVEIHGNIMSPDKIVSVVIGREGMVINNCVICVTRRPGHSKVHNAPDRTAGEIIGIKCPIYFGGRRRSLARVTSMAVHKRDEIIRTHHTIIWLLNSNHFVAFSLVFVRMLNARGSSINL